MSRVKAIGLSLLAVLILVVTQLVANIIAGVPVMLFGMSATPMYIIAAVLYPLLAYITLKVLFEQLFHVKMSELGVTKFKISAKWLILGILLPVAVTCFYLVAIKGQYVSHGISGVKVLFEIAKGVCYTGIACGLVEEMIFRGAMMRLLQKAFNTPVAVIVPSVLFGAVHIIGYSFSPLSCLLVVVAGSAVGIMFSLISLEGGSIWNNALAHSLWNVVIIGGFIVIGQETDSTALVSYVLDSKSFLVTGGDFGIESSLISLIGYVIVAIIAFMMLNKKEDKNEA